jgi:hypothetical protein
MSATQLAPARFEPKHAHQPVWHHLVMLLPLLVGAAIALAPAPPGLPQYA